MPTYVRLVAIWLAFGLALAAMALVLLGSQWEPGRLPGLGNWFAAWVLWALALGAVSLRFRSAAWHGHAVGLTAGILNTALLLVLLACVTRVLFELVPGFRELAATAFLDRTFGGTWTALNQLSERFGVGGGPGSVLTAPLLLAGLALGGRLLVTWGAGQLVPERRGPEAVGGEPVRFGTPEPRGRASLPAAPEAPAAQRAPSGPPAADPEATFLAVDLMGGASIRQGEDPYVIEQSFADYRKLVERMLRRYGANGHSWTPYRQTAEFRTPQAAVDCGRDLLLALPAFNRDVSRLRRDFRLRLLAERPAPPSTGREARAVSAPEAGDTARSPEAPDALWVSQEVYQRLGDGAGFLPELRGADGRNSYVWKRPA